MAKTTVTDQQEEQRISQLLSSDKRFKGQTDNLYYQTLKLISDNIRAFYARYASSKGLTADVVRERVTHWDLDQFMHAIDLLTNGDQTSDDLKKRLKLIKYQAAGGNHADAVAAVIGATIAVTTDKVQRSSRQHLADDYVSEQQYQQIIASKHEEWQLPHVQGVQIKPAISHAIDGSDWSAALWNHSDNMVADVQKTVRNSLNGGLQQEQLNSLLARLAPGQVVRGNLIAASESEMWMVDRLIRTESAKVVDDATMAALTNRKVELVDLVVEPDACQICLRLAANGPYTLKACPQIPQDTHPNCRCKKVEHDLNRNGYIDSLRNQYETAKNVSGSKNVPSSFEDYVKMRYNDPKESKVFSDYQNSRAKNSVPAIVGYRDYKRIKKLANRQLIGITTNDGIRINQVSQHGLERIIGTDEDIRHGGVIRNGVHFSELIEALTKGNVIVSPKDNQVHQYIGSDAKVTVNSKTGNIIQTNPYKIKKR